MCLNALKHHHIFIFVFFDILPDVVLAISILMFNNDVEFRLAMKLIDKDKV